MDWLATIGYVASALTFVTFCMTAILPLRYIALCSNAAFIAYGYFAHLHPVLFLHLFLLPLNGLRVFELRKLIGQVRQAGEGEVPIEHLLPFATKRRFNAGDILFYKGDRAHEMYYILSGAIRVDEIQRDIGPGQIAGVIGVFAPEKKRPWTAVCKMEVELLAVSNEKVMQAFYQNPRFGMSLARLITKRAIADMSP
jgi:hypothetical protein